MHEDDPHHLAQGVVLRRARARARARTKDEVVMVRVLPAIEGDEGTAKCR